MKFPGKWHRPKLDDATAMLAYPQVRQVGPGLWQGMRAGPGAWVVEIFTDDFNHTLDMVSASTREKAFELADLQLQDQYIVDLMAVDREWDSDVEV